MRRSMMVMKGYIPDRQLSLFFHSQLQDTECLIMLIIHLKGFNAHSFCVYCNPLKDVVEVESEPHFCQSACCYFIYI